MNRRRAVLVPITWHTVPWNHRRPRSWEILGQARGWCREHVGVERADWEYQAQWRRWRFRDAGMAVLFQLTWC